MSDVKLKSLELAIELTKGLFHGENVEITNDEVSFLLETAKKLEAFLQG